MKATGPARRLPLPPFLPSLLEQLADGWIALDGDGRVARLSESLRRLRGEASGALPHDIASRLDRETSALRPGEVSAFSLSWPSAEGDQIRFRVVAAAAGVSGPDGRGWVVCAFRRRPTAGASVRSGRRPAPGRGWAVREIICWEDLLSEVLAGLRRDRSPALRVELEIGIDPGLPRCAGDRGLLLRMLREASVAALSSMPDGGTLFLQVRRADLTDGVPAVRLLVRDTGRGIDESTVARILRGSGESSGGRVEEALRTVRGVAELHHGRMHLVSAPGRGTSVVIDLPAIASPEIVADSVCAEAA